MTAIDLLVTSGNGPVECRIALMSLVEKIQAEARQSGCVVETAFGPQPDQHGAKSALLTLDPCRLGRAWAQYDPVPSRHGFRPDLRCARS